jgi:hypothetical protein
MHSQARGHGVAHLGQWTGSQGSNFQLCLRFS